MNYASADDILWF